MTTVADIIAKMPERFNKEAATGMNAIYQYHITGDTGAIFYTEISNAALNIVQGEHPHPNITITMSATDYVDLVEGKLNAQMAYLGGKIKIQGDLSLAMKLASLFKQSRSA